MTQGIYTALSGALARQQQLEYVSHDIANTTTPGYRAHRVAFEEVLIDEGTRQTAVSTVVPDMRGGPLDPTGNPLDVAVEGTGWFTVQGAQGPLLTRAGNFVLNGAGALLDAQGRPVLDADGAPIQASSTGGQIRFGEDGSVHQDGRRLGRLGIMNPGPIPPEGLAGVALDGAGATPAEVGSFRIRPGFVERSGVEPFRAMVDMVVLQRSFDAAHELIRENHSMDRRAIRALGK